jgi:hypothetical protein
MKLKRNMGPADQVFRASMGIGLIYLGPVSQLLTADFMSGMLLALVGALTVISAASGYCPLYHMAGFCTYRPKDKVAGDDD